MPERIQRKRTKGWRMPPNTVSVTRPAKWGNPYRVGIDGSASECVRQFREMVKRNIWSHPNSEEIQRELRGKDLACWCKIGDPCHARMFCWRLPMAERDPRLEPMPHLIQFALDTSLQSPCQSKRGVVIFDGDNLVSVGYNYQPSPFICDGTEQCKMSCGKTAVHAEQHALLFAGRSVGGCGMLHVKSVGGKISESMGPSCIYCSKLMVAAGISGMWLFHHSGWKWYPINEFHWLSAGSPRLHLAWAATAEVIRKETTMPEKEGGRYFMDHYQKQHEQSSAEAAACIKFLQSELGWEDFRSEGFVGAESVSASEKNCRRLAAFLKDRGNHGVRFLEEWESILGPELLSLRKSQDDQHGGPSHDDTHIQMDWLGFIEKQLRFARCAIQQEPHETALLNVAAIAIAAIQSSRRKRNAA